MSSKKNSDTTLIFSAHSDDWTLGAGGTVAKYVQEGKKVIVVIFSYGEKSHPWLKHKVVKDMRFQETIEASKILQCKIIFFDLKEFNFYDDAQRKNVPQKILQLIQRKKPSKIFTHSGEDPHPDHRAVNKITLELYEKFSVKPEIFVYAIWNPVSFRTAYPTLYVDISKTFTDKLQALRTFRSQRFQAIYPLFFLVLFRAIKEGFSIKKRFAEKFFRVR